MKNIKQILTTNKTPILVAFIGAFLMFPSQLHIIVNAIDSDLHFWKSLDPSWTIALNYSIINDLNFGKDIAFTYGPLSFLITRVAWGVNKYYFILFDVFCFVNYFYLIYFTYKKAKVKLIYLLFLALCILCLPINNSGGYSIILFFIFIFWMSLCLDNFKKIYLISPIILTILLFFIKFNTGLVTLLVLNIFIFIFYFKSNISFKELIALVISPIALIILLSFGLNVTLFDYIISGFNLVKGYNEIMYVNDNGVLILKITTILVFFICAFFMFFKITNKKEIFSYLKTITPYLFLFFIGFYILYKQSFVRADKAHTEDFFKYFLFLIICINLFFNKELKSLFNVLLITPVLFIFYLKANQEFSFYSVTEKTNKLKYFKQLNGFSKISGMYLFPNNNKLPDDILTIIGKSTIDTFPWNIHMLIENNLNYSPRPVLQSYSSYTKQLEELNFNFYNSEKAPQYVLYDNASIDNRYPYFDESKVYALLEKKYRPIKTFSFLDRTLLLLEKINNENFKLVKTKVFSSKMNSDILLQPDMFYEIKASKTVFGEISSLINYSPELSIIISSNKKSTINRTSLSLLESGIYTSNYIESTDDFYKSYSSKDNYIEKISVVPLNNDYFKDEIQITEYKITQ